MNTLVPAFPNGFDAALEKRIADILAAELARLVLEDMRLSGGVSQAAADEIPPLLACGSVPPNVNSI